MQNLKVFFWWRKDLSVLETTGFFLTFSLEKGKNKKELWTPTIGDTFFIERKKDGFEEKDF